MIKQVEEEYVTFSYSDIIFSYFFSDDCKCSKMVREHFLVYIYSGEYHLEEGNRKIIIRSGECAFLRRDNRVNMTKMPKGGKPFQGIFMMFKRSFLRDVYQKTDHKNLPFDIEKHRQSIIKLPETPDIKGLFLSMMPYFNSSVKPMEEMMNLKQLEGIYSLLNIDKRFYATLFDFTEPWKIDILDFLNENYMCELSMEEIASFTGRSLSTFKRDFKKISDLSPQKWIIQRRLQEAYDLIKKDGKRVTDVYIKVGFKNLSHFSTAFKKQYGFSPTQ